MLHRTRDGAVRPQVIALSPGPSPLHPTGQGVTHGPMLKARVIPCLDVKDGRVVKGVPGTGRYRL